MEKILWTCLRNFQTPWNCVYYYKIKRTCGRIVSVNKNHNTNSIYKAIIRPKISYAATIWWQKCEVLSVRKRLAKVQRLPLISITGAMKSTPTAGISVMKKANLALGMPTDNIAPTYRFERQFDITVPSRDEWKRESTVTPFNWLTNSSGTGVYSPQLDQSRQINISQEEITGLIKGDLENCLDGGVTILSHSQSTLKVLR